MSKSTKMQTTNPASTLTTTSLPLPLAKLPHGHSSDTHAPLPSKSHHHTPAPHGSEVGDHQRSPAAPLLARRYTTASRLDTRGSEVGIGMVRDIFEGIRVVFGWGGRCLRGLRGGFYGPHNVVLRGYVFCYG